MTSQPGGSAPAPSAVQQERVAFRRRRAQKRAAVAAVSLIVVFGALSAIVVNSPGWPAVQRTFFDWGDAKHAFPSVAKAFWLNIRLFCVTEVFILIVAVIVAVIRVVPSPALAPFKVLAVLYVDAFRGVPTILVVLLVGFGVPALNLTGTPTSLFWLGSIALTLSYGAYVAEVIRAGILSVHPSQVASGRAVGLTYPQTMRHVVLPQAMRRVVPPLINDFVSLQKDTALISIVGLVEALRAAQVISSRDFTFTPYVVAAVLFIAATIVFARLSDWLMLRSIRRDQGISA